MINGSDVNGRYEGVVFSYEAGSTPMENQILVYDEGRFVRFTQVRYSFASCHIGLHMKPTGHRHARPVNRVNELGWWRPIDSIGV